MLRKDLFPSPPALILDVGCGHGRAVEAIANDGWDVVAFDADVAHVYEATCRTARAIGCVGDARAQPFRDCSIDGVVAMEIIEHLAEPRELVDELHRVVRPGGAAMFTVPNGALERVYRRLNPAYWPTTTHQQMFSKRALAALLRASGFDVISVHSSSFEWAVRWFVHALLRSRFDATGEVHEHYAVADAMERAFRRLRRFKVATRALAAASLLAGKSHVAECRRPMHLRG